MKLAIGRNELLKSVQSVMGAVARKSTLPVLTFLHVKSDGEEISLTATDLETTLVSRLEHTSEPFETLLPAKRLHDVLRAFQDGSVVGLEEKDGKIILTRAVWVFRWSGVGFDGVIANPKSDQVTLKKMTNPVEIPAGSEIFRVPVKADWGL